MAERHGGPVHTPEADDGRPRGAGATPRRDVFGEMASWTAKAAGGRWGFLCALAVVLIWAAVGPFFGFSEMWQMVINTGTTIVTFLMVFLIQNAQNRESKAIHLKLDELIFSLRNARNDLIDIENLTESQLDLMAMRYHTIAMDLHEFKTSKSGDSGSAQRDRPVHDRR